MTTIHKPEEKRTFRDHTVLALKAIAVVAILAVLAQISWNMFAPDLFAMPEMRMKQALGLVVFAGIVSAMMRHPTRWRRQ